MWDPATGRPLGLRWPVLGVRSNCALALNATPAAYTAGSCSAWLVRCACNATVHAAMRAALRPVLGGVPGLG